MNKSYWISWYSHEPINEFELHSPWWISGWTSNSLGDWDIPTVIAAVRAPDADAAVTMIRNAYDNPPTVLSLRFCDEILKADPFSERFPKEHWMEWDGDRTCICDECAIK